MKFDLVFQGGGARGMAYVGAMKAFERQSLDMRRLVGTSAGAINAALLAAGYSYKEMAAALDEVDEEGNPIFEGFMTPPLPSEFEDKVFSKSLTLTVLRAVEQYFLAWWSTDHGDQEPTAEESIGWIQTLISTVNTMDALVPIAARMLLSQISQPYQGFVTMAFNFIEQGGIFSARKFMDWMDDRLAEKDLPADITFLQLFEKNGYDLTLVGSDITAGNMLVLNHITSPDLPVRWAVRMSMNIPFVWDPVIWQNSFGLYRGKNINGHRVVDGGALSNFAIRLTTSDSADVRAVMDTRLSPHEAPTIGFILDGDLPVPGALPPEKQDPIELPWWLNWLGTLVSSLNYIRTDASNPTNFMNTAGELILTMMVATDNLAIDANTDQICRLPVKGFGTLEFGMSEQRRNALVNAAQNTTEEFLKQMPTSHLIDLTLEVGETGMFEIAFDLNGTPGKKDWIGLFTSASATDKDYTKGNWEYVRNVENGRFVTNTKAELGTYVARYYRYTSNGYELVKETGSFIKVPTVTH